MPPKSAQRNRLRDQRAKAAAASTNSTTETAADAEPATTTTVDDAAQVEVVESAPPAAAAPATSAAENAESSDDDEIAGEAPAEAIAAKSVAVAPLPVAKAPPRDLAAALTPVVQEASSSSSSWSSWSSWGSSWVASSVSAVSDIAATAISETSKALDTALRDDADALKDVADKLAPASAAQHPAPQSMQSDDNNDDDDAADEKDAIDSVVDGVDSLVGGLMGALSAATANVSKAIPLDKVTSQLNELGTHADLTQVSNAANSVVSSSMSMLERVGARAFDLLTVRETNLDQPGEQRVAARFAAAAPSTSAPVKTASTSAASAASDDFHSIFDAAMGSAHAEALERLSMHATLRTQRLLGALDAAARAEAAKVQQSLTQLFEDEDEDDGEKDANTPPTTSLPAKAQSVQTQLQERAAAAKAELQSLVARVSAELGDDSVDASGVAENARRVLRSVLAIGVPAMASCAALATEVMLRTGEAAMVDIEPDEPAPRADVAPLRAQASESARAAQALAQTVQQIASDVVAAGTAVRNAARVRLASAAEATQLVDDAATAAVKDAYLQAGRAVQHIANARQFLAPIWATLAL